MRGIRKNKEREALPVVVVVVLKYRSNQNKWALSLFN